MYKREKRKDNRLIKFANIKRLRKTNQKKGCVAVLISEEKKKDRSPKVLCIYAQSCLTFCSPMDCRPPDSSAHGISQTRILEWVAISPFRESSWPMDWASPSYVSCIGRWVLYHECHLRRPKSIIGNKNASGRYCDLGFT